MLKKISKICTKTEEMEFIVTHAIVRRLSPNHMYCSAWHIEEWFRLDQAGRPHHLLQGGAGLQGQEGEGEVEQKLADGYLLHSKPPHLEVEGMRGLSKSDLLPLL